MKNSFLIKPVLDGKYPVIDYGKGIYLYDENGKQYIDGSSGAVTACLGHALPEIIDAITEQAKRVSFVYRSQFTSYPAERLAEKLAVLTPDKIWYSFFVNSGSEATETAMKIAVQYWQEMGYKGKNRFISRWMSYHGITIGALSVSGHVGRRSRFIPLLKDYPSLPPPYCYRCPLHLQYPSCHLRCADELESIISRVGAEHIAGFIAEPIIGAAGAAIVPPAGYYERISEICKKHDILFIADEVMSGLGRTGTMFAIDHWKTKPDMITLGKGMTAGYSPMAAVLADEEIIEKIYLGSNLIMSGHTFSANPQSAATALAVLSYIEKHNLLGVVKKNGDYLIQKLTELQQEMRIIGDVRGKGLLVGVEFVTDHFHKLPFNKELNITSTIVQRSADYGLLVYPAAAGENGISGDAVLIAPPYIITTSQIDELVSIFRKVIHEIQKELQLLGIIQSVM